MSGPGLGMSPLRLYFAHLCGEDVPGAADAINLLDDLEAERDRLLAALAALYEEVASAWDEEDIDNNSSYAQRGGIVRARTLAKAREALGPKEES